MITLEQAKALRPGDMLHAELLGDCRRVATKYRPTTRVRDLGPERWKVNGQVQTWKRDPSRVRVPIKHGLYVYDQVTERDLVDVHLEAECPHSHPLSLRG